MVTINITFVDGHSKVILPCSAARSEFLNGFFKPALDDRAVTRGVVYM